MSKGRPGRWPLALIAAPAAVAIWSGWVGLGELCGFGPVNLAPGIGGGFTLNTAITLPVGVEAYAAYALKWWMDPEAPGKARTFAKWSALGALGYGMLGQVVYHLLAAAHVAAAPWPVVVLVSCMPVIVLGFAAALTHMLRADDGAPKDVAGENLPTTTGAGILPGHPPVSVGVSLPGVREIQRRQQCSPTTAKKIRAELGRITRGHRLVPYEIPARETAPVMGAPAGAAPGSTPVPAGASLNGAQAGAP